MASSSEWTPPKVYNPYGTQKGVSAFWKDKYEKEAAKNWDLFYRRNKTNFFKDRHYIHREFHELNECSSKPDQSFSLLEVGCGVGNTVFPLVEEFPNVFVYCFDFSAHAVELVKENESYNEDRVKAFVCDIAHDDNQLAPSVPDNTVNLVTMIFILSAVAPEKMARVVSRLFDCMKPGGVLFFRDYCEGDMAEVRFAEDQKIEDRFFVRQDGTRSYFFSEDFAKSLFTEAGFVVLDLQVCERDVVNRKENLTMHRRWLQLRCQKPPSS